MQRIRERYRIDLPLATLVEYPTVRRLAGRLRSVRPESAGAWTPLVTLNPLGRSQPLFCVAGLGGHIMELHQLARHLGGDLRLYGLETRGVAGHEPHATIEAMAAENLAAIRTIQDEGPYLLAGYSVGGVVAYEMAQQLRRQGQDTGLLALLDSDSPTLPRRTGWRFRRSQLLRLLADPRGFLADSWRRHFGPPPADPRFLKVQAAVAQAYHCYRPEPYDGDIHLFRTHKNEVIGDIRWIVDPCNGWRDLVTGRIEVIPVPGQHLTMLQDPANARPLAERLRAVVLAAQNKDD